MQIYRTVSSVKLIAEKAILPLGTLALGVVSTWAFLKKERQISNILKSTKRIESILEEYFGAYGKGLHSKVSSVQRKLDKSDVDAIRLIASIRNKAVHDEKAELDIKQFNENKIYIMNRFRNEYNIL